MHSFQVEQVMGIPTKYGRTSRMVRRLSLVFAALLVVVITLLANGSSLTGFAQSLLTPQQVLGVSAQNNICVGAPYQKPKAITLNALQPGLQYSEDEPQFYTIYGSTVDDLRTAIMNCEARKQSGDYHALTTYVLNWQYDTVASAGQCTLGNVKVGLATNQYLPRLAKNQILPNEDRAKWDSYYANLVSHENEHLALDKQYAADLHNALLNLSAPCSSLQTTVDAIIQSHVQLLNSANSQLDSQTNHGANTGAIL